MHINDHIWRMPSTYLRVFLQHANTEQLPLEPVLEGTELEAGKLLERDHPVSFGDTQMVLQNVTRMLGPGWHLGLGERLNLASHGPLGFAMVTAANFQAAVDVLLRFIGIRGPFLWLAGAREGGRFVIRFFEATPMDSVRNTLIELALLSVQVLLERPLGRQLNGARIAFAYPAPGYLQSLESAFHAELAFDRRGHSMSFPAALLNEACMMHDPAMHRYLLSRCEDEMQRLQGSLPAEVTVRQALMARPGILPGLREIAASQHVSPRTMIRRLKQGNTSYQAILEDVRKKLAVDYLLYSNLNISRISYRLGYQDPSNFGRAFRGWFGQSPGHYRRSKSGAPKTQAPISSGAKR
jgi:AraC-like DNA-binding protein